VAKSHWLGRVYAKSGPWGRMMGSRGSRATCGRFAGRRVGLLGALGAGRGVDSPWESSSV